MRPKCERCRRSIRKRPITVHNPRDKIHKYPYVHDKLLEKCVIINK